MWDAAVPGQITSRVLARLFYGAMQIGSWIYCIVSSLPSSETVGDWDVCDCGLITQPLIVVFPQTLINKQYAIQHHELWSWDRDNLQAALWGNKHMSDTDMMRWGCIHRKTNSLVSMVNISSLLTGSTWARVTIGFKCQFQGCFRLNLGKGLVI